VPAVGGMDLTKCTTMALDTIPNLAWG